MAHHHHHHAASSSEWEHKCGGLAAELTAGREVAKQLQLIPSSSEQAATREVLVQKILASYENALSMLSTPRMMPAQHHHDDGDIGTVVMMKSSPPGTRSGSPGSEDSDHDLFKDTTSSRKRKSIPRWTHQVRVGPGMGLEGPLDDGFSWRKYGQKDILGAKYPRGYYRCTLRNVQGCLATKQVQRSDDDSTVFEITYRGRHTCTQSQSQSPSTSSSPAPNNTVPPPPSEPAMTLAADDRQHEQLLLNFRNGLNVVVTDDGSEFDCSPPTTATAASTYAGSLFFPPPQDATVMMTSFSAPTSSTYSSVYHHSFSGAASSSSNENVNISYGREQSTTAAAAPPVDFPFGNMDHLFDDPTTFTFDNSGFFS
ncbi:unnamed protein product [Linum tenue]|uniref:WRKY domain-containing protein n=1 Tax=Linum tenue TaxID=586396 RepID=A0AAV0JWE8_9ROSI|nr:unnamed protein product [Linum tenue]